MPLPKAMAMYGIFDGWTRRETEKGELRSPRMPHAAATSRDDRCYHCELFTRDHGTETKMLVPSVVALQRACAIS